MALQSRICTCYLRRANELVEMVAEKRVLGNHGLRCGLSASSSPNLSTPRPDTPIAGCEFARPGDRNCGRTTRADGISPPGLPRPCQPLRRALLRRRQGGLLGARGSLLRCHILRGRLAAKRAEFARDLRYRRSNVCRNLHTHPPRWYTRPGIVVTEAKTERSTSHASA